MVAATTKGATMRLRYGQLNVRSPKADDTHHVQAEAADGSSNPTSAKGRPRLTGDIP
jgi:hypothetical protein